MKEEIKLGLRLFDNSLSKYLIFKIIFLYAMAVFDYLPKLKRGQRPAFGAHFPRDFSIKNFLT